MDSYGDDDVEARLREVRRRLDSLSGTLRERNVNVESTAATTKEAGCSYPSQEVAPLPHNNKKQEAGAHLTLEEEDGEPFDAFQFIQRRLREKVRNLRCPQEQAATPAPSPTESTAFHMPHRCPTVDRRQDAADGAASPLCSTECSPPPRDCSAETARPDRDSDDDGQPSVEIHLSYSLDTPDRENAGRSLDAVDTQGRTRPVEKRVVGARRRPQVRASSPLPSPPESSAVRQRSKSGGAACSRKPSRTSSHSRSRSAAVGSSAGSASRSRRSTSTRKSEERAGQQAGWNTNTSVGREPPPLPKPRPLWTDATILEAVTGAELLAIFRMRGLVTSVGDTGEDRLPPRRCHAVYLTSREHEQLQMLREVLEHRVYAARQQSVLRK